LLESVVDAILSVVGDDQYTPEEARIAARKFGYDADQAIDWLLNCCDGWFRTFRFLHRAFLLIARAQKSKTRRSSLEMMRSERQRLLAVPVRMPHLFFPPLLGCPPFVSPFSL
jgi:hypothetical protein